MPTYKKIILSGHNVSELNNDAGYLTSVGSVSWGDISGKPSIFMHDYVRVTGNPVFAGTNSFTGTTLFINTTTQIQNTTAWSGKASLGFKVLATGTSDLYGGIQLSRQGTSGYNSQLEFQTSVYNNNLRTVMTLNSAGSLHLDGTVYANGLIGKNSGGFAIGSIADYNRIDFQSGTFRTLFANGSIAPLQVGDLTASSLSSGNATFNSDVFVSEYIRHFEDNDTNIRFQTDHIDFTTSGGLALRIDDSQKATFSSNVYVGGNLATDIITNYRGSQPVQFQTNEVIIGRSGIQSVPNKLVLRGHSVPYSGGGHLAGEGFLQFDTNVSWTGAQRKWAITNAFGMGINNAYSGNLTFLVGTDANQTPTLGMNGALGTAEGEKTVVGMRIDGSGVIHARTGNSDNWNTAYGWGDHSTQGYLTSHQDISSKANLSDPTFVLRINTPQVRFTDSSKTSFNHLNVAQWSTAYGWGNHADAGYLTRETDSQTLSISGKTLSISNGNSITLPTDNDYLTAIRQTGGDYTPNSTTFQNVLVAPNGSNTRAVYFDGGAGASAVSTWYGVQNKPYSAIDVSQTYLSIWTNNSSGTWKRMLDVYGDGSLVKANSDLTVARTEYDGDIKLGNTTYFSTIRQRASSTGKLEINQWGGGSTSKGIHFQINGEDALQINHNKTVTIQEKLYANNGLRILQLNPAVGKNSLMLASDGDVYYRELGDNAFTSYTDHASAGYLTSHQDISGKANLSGATFTGHVDIASSTPFLYVGDGTANNDSSWDSNIMLDSHTHSRLRIENRGNNRNIEIYSHSGTSQPHIRATDSSTRLYVGVAGSESYFDNTGTITTNGDGNSEQWKQAYDWGDHASAGYLRSESQTLAQVVANGDTSNQTVKLLKNGDGLKVGGIRGHAIGSQTGDYIHMYERVHIGNPSGWGHSGATAPDNGLGVYGGIDIGQNNSGYIKLNGSRKDQNWDTAYGWGNHASAGYLTSHQSLANYTTVGSNISQFANNSGYLTSSGIINWSRYAVMNDTRSTLIAPYSGGKLVRWDFKYNSKDGLNDGGTYHSVLQINQWSDNSGGRVHQLGFTDNNNVWTRTNLNDTTWNSWHRLAHASEIPSLSGYATQSWVNSQGFLTSQTDSQTLSISGNELTISNGNRVTLPSYSNLTLSDVRSYIESDDGIRAVRFDFQSYDTHWDNDATNSKENNTPMSIKLWDSYNHQAKSGTDPYGTILDIYGRSGHQRNQFFMGSTGYVYHRSTFYNQPGWQNWYRFWSTKNLEANVVSTLRSNYNRWLTSHQDISGKANVSSPTFTGHIRLSGSGRTIGGFGAVTTAGTTDWNHDSNAISGSGYTLLLGNATNGHGFDNDYYHPFNWEYARNDGQGNMTQLAVPYSGTGAFAFRTRYSGNWTSWRRIIDTGTISVYADKTPSWVPSSDPGYLTSSSTINASAVSGYGINSSDTNNQANKIMRTQANGYAHFGWINTTSGEFTGTPNRIYASNDGYLRYMTLENFSNRISTQLNLPSDITNTFLKNRYTRTPDTVGDSTGAIFNYMTSDATNRPPGTDHALMTMSWSADWQTQMAQDWRNSGRIHIRGQLNGTWSSWGQVWSSHDFANNSSNWDTAYSWGNHASAGYLTAVPSSLGSTTFNGQVNFSSDVTLSATNSLKIPSGSSVASLPFSFRDDTDVGLWNPSNNALGFVTAGVERINISDVGVTNIKGELRINNAGKGLFVQAGYESPFTQNIAEFKYGGNSNSIIIKNVLGQASISTSGTSLQLSANDNIGLTLNTNRSAVFGGAVESGSHHPSGDNTVDLGHSGAKWRQIHATNIYAVGITVEGGNPRIIAKGSSNGYVNGAFVTSSIDINRGGGLFMHDRGNQNEWFCGRPYSNNDQFIIARNTGVADHSGATAQAVNEVWKIDNNSYVHSHVNIANSYRLKGTNNYPRFERSGDDAYIGTNSQNTAFYIYDNGNARVVGSLTAYQGNSNQWNTAYGWGDHARAGYQTSRSDLRLKTGVRTVKNATDKVLKLRGVDFTWKDSGKPGGGVIAQEVEKVLPDYVADLENGTGHKAVDYNGLVGVLIESVKELTKEVEYLKSKLND